MLLVTTPTSSFRDTVKTAQLANRLTGPFSAQSSIARPATRCRVHRRADGVPAASGLPDDPQATTEEPLVLNAPESTAADAYQRLSEALEGVFFHGESPERDIETILDDEWFIEDTEDHSDADDEDSRSV
ncbi:hypothetical protein C8039_16480 [Halogeometricum sp. wsp3]|nr:hypothetical protein C8039_16480 [Halogeometricum sp. wsp3]